MRLLLSKGKWPEIDMDLAVSTIEGRKRMEKKVPSWSGKGLIYPGRLCTEQCSSEETAMVKASIAERIFPGGFSLADLTGGIGVDSWAFSLHAKKILHNEADKNLSEAVRFNFGKLGATNAEFTSFKVVPDSVPETEEERHITSLLGDFKPDVIFLDPARRSFSGKKVFLLEDCSPDVTALMPTLLETSPEVLMKLSPMADIPMVLSRIGDGVREVHVIGADSECKELVIRISRGFSGAVTVHVHEGGKELIVPLGEERERKAFFLDSPEELVRMPESGGCLFIPGKTISKAGLFNWMSSEWKMAKAAPSAHIYFIGEGVSLGKEVSSFGRVLSIVEAVPLTSSSMKDIGKRFPKADVLSKDMPIQSEELAKKMGVTQGGEFMIVGCPVHFSGKDKDGKWLFVCRK